MPRDEETAAPASPVATELAAYRSRLEEKLAARRSGARPAATLGAASRPATGPASRPATRPLSLAVGALALAGVVGAGVLAWPLLPDRPALVEAREALATERGRNQQLAEELMATTRALKAQAMAMADRDAREAEIETLREELKQAGEIAVMRDHFLAQAQERIRQLAVTSEPPAAAAAPVALPVAVPTVAPVAVAVAPVPVAIAAVPVALPAVEPVAAAQPPAASPPREVPPIAQPDGDLPKLMARARLLLGQGDIGGARAVLERAATSGNALALFALAETFDPAILATWGTKGTRGDVARAHALYQQAYAAGVDAAADRLAVLR